MKEFEKKVIQELIEFYEDYLENNDLDRIKLRANNLYSSYLQAKPLLNKKVNGFVNSLAGFCVPKETGFEAPSKEEAKRIIKKLKRFEKENALWKEFHELWDKIENKKIALVNALTATFKLALKFIESADKKEKKEILIAFENIKDLMLIVYKKDAVNIYENGLEGDILADFDSAAKKEDYDGLFKELSMKIKKYLKWKK